MISGESSLTLCNVSCFYSLCLILILLFIISVCYDDIFTFCRDTKMKINVLPRLDAVSPGNFAQPLWFSCTTYCTYSSMNIFFTKQMMILMVLIFYITCK